MAQVARQVKPGGNTQFADEVAGGFVPLLVGDLDNDLNAIIAGVNSINASQITAGAVGNTQLASGAVNDAKVAGNANINGSKLLNASIGSIKMQPGASVNTRNEVFLSPNIPFAGVQVDVLSLAITPRSAVVDVFCAAMGRLGPLPDGNPRTLGLMLFRGPTLLAIQSVEVVVQAGAPTLFFPFSIPISYCDVAAAPGVANTYGLSVIPSPGLGGVVVSAHMYLKEHA